MAAVAALAVSSCTYNPYYNTTAGYYGHGYGYGGTRFSTGAFIGTGNSRWGYDPYVRAYYDYDRRAYYDPYLYGYYLPWVRMLRIYKGLKWLGSK